MWDIIKTERFEKEFERLPKDIKERFNKQIDKVIIDPFGIGKPLGNSHSRELKNGGFRVYYMIYEEKVIVLFVGISGKKDQQKTISEIRDEKKSFKLKYIKEKIIKYGEYIFTMDPEIEALIKRKDQLVK
jgi:mRNA-degrading endonuclease RelE of RelBE toxin-antitoxin system